MRTETSNFTYLDQPPVLVGASSQPALARALRTVETAGRRIGDAMMLGSARERLERQIAASAVWLELDHQCGADLNPLLDCIDRGVTEGRFGAVVSTSADLIDPVAARIECDAVEVIVDADDAERVAALAIAAARVGEPCRLSDIASDQNAARLRQLSDEVSRIAATLARLSSGPRTATLPVEPSKNDAPEVSAETVRSVIRARRLRSRYFPGDLFADPAWDMLLDLLQAEIAQLRVPVSSLCIAAAVPATTALRWLKTMVGEGLFVRRADPHDGRRVFVELAPEASWALRRYFAEAGSPPVI
jgi:hypothetical protein